MKNWLSRFYSSTLFFPFIVLLLYILICIFTPITGFTADIDCWIRWSAQIYQFGLPKAYLSGAVYMPFLLYILYLYDFFQSSTAAISENIIFLKYITLIFDFAGALAVVSFVKDKKKQTLFFSFIVLNIAYLYNTVIWGMVDAIHSTLIVLSLLFIYKKNMIASTVFFMLAVCMKFQAIIYAPVFVILWLSHLYRSRNYKPLVQSLVVNIILIVLMFAPFIYGTGLSFTYNHLSDAILSHSNKICVSAYNFWELIMDGPLWDLTDLRSIWGIHYKTMGTILFILFLIPSLIPLLRLNLYNTNEENSKLAISKIFLSLALVTLVFFYFKTGMHERYAHSSIIFLAGYACLTLDFIPYILCSVAYLYQLNNVMIDSSFVPLFRFYLNKEFVSVLFLITIIYCMFRIYYPVKKRSLPEHQ